MNNKNKTVGEMIPLDLSLKLDLKNRKIISELMKNARAPLSQISRIVRLSKSNVARRIKKLEKVKLITGYHGFVDVTKFDINSTILFLKTKHTQQEKEFLINKTLRIVEVYSIVTITGEYDILVGFYYFNKPHKENTIEQLLKSFDVKDFSLMDIKTTFPLLDYTQDLEKNKLIKAINDNERDIVISLDKIDIEILKDLSNNCRKNIIDIAYRIKIPRETISYRIKRLIKEKVIAKFQPTINLFLLGFESYMLKLKINEQSKKEKIKIYLSNTYRCNTILLSEDEWCIICFIHFKSNQEFKQFEERLLNEFSSSIFEYSFELIKSQYKLNWFSEEFADLVVKTYMN